MKTKTHWDEATAEEREAITRKILRVVELVAEMRHVEALKIMSLVREREEIASARSMAMAVCVEIGVEKCHVARAFRRNWSTIQQAIHMSENRYRHSTAYRTQWDWITGHEAFKA